jgi:hypothetical protein
MARVSENVKRTSLFNKVINIKSTAVVAQLAEQSTHRPKLVGSNPTVAIKREKIAEKT